MFVPMKLSVFSANYLFATRLKIHSFIMLTIYKKNVTLIVPKGREVFGESTHNGVL